MWVNKIDHLSDSNIILNSLTKKNKAVFTKYKQIFNKMNSKVEFIDYIYFITDNIEAFNKFIKFGLI